MSELETVVPEEKKRRVLTDEQKLKMKEGRQRSRQSRAEAPIAPSVIISKNKVKVFGDVDRNRDGRIKSQYPAWYHRAQIDELEESVRRGEREVENYAISAEQRAEKRVRLEKEKKRLEQIMESKPQLDGNTSDEISKVVKEVGQEIASAMFTRDDMRKGTADAHEEARRMSEPIINIKDERQAEFARACGVNISENGRITRSGAEKMWKIGRRLLGDGSNTELLRK